MNTGSWALLLLCVLHLHFGHTQQKPELTLKDMPMTTSNQLTITGIPKLDANKFSINIGDGKNIALHFDVRFKYEGEDRTVIFNSKQDNSWSSMWKKDEHFPFAEGEKFKVIITFSKDEFLVRMPGNHISSFPNRFKAEMFRLIEIHGDVRIMSFSIH